MKCVDNPHLITSQKSKFKETIPYCPGMRQTNLVSVSFEKIDGFSDSNSKNSLEIPDEFPIFGVAWMTSILY